MMKRILAFILILPLMTDAQSQLKTYLNLETGPQWSMIKVIDPGGYFTDANVRSTMAGISLSKEFIENLSLTAGISYIPAKAGINMEDRRRFQPAWRSHTSLLIPLALEYRIRLSEFPVSLIPRLGYVYHLVRMPDDPYSASSVLGAPDGSAFSYSFTQSIDPPGKHMLETGVSLDLQLYGLWRASLNLSYLTGLGTSSASILDYTDQNFNTREAEYRFKGNAILTTLAFHVPVSNIWQNRDYRIRSRVEQSAGEGKPTDRKGEFYAGAEAGSLWRVFSASNPAVGPRPMEGRGLFSYADLHSGIYAGYMLNDDLGIDLGVAYQQSSTFYALMYDHSVNYVTRSHAPMFLEVPIRIRYFYELYKGKLHYVVYGGASLLTHFAGADYGTGGGEFIYLSPESGVPARATTNYTATRTARVRPMVRLGTGFEYRLPLEFPLIATLYAGYYHGFIGIDNTEVSTSLAESPSVSSVIYRGSGWSVDAGVKIPFRFNKGGVCAPKPEREEVL